MIRLALRLGKSHWALLADARGSAAREGGLEGSARGGAHRDLQEVGLWPRTPPAGEAISPVGLFKFARDKALTVDVFHASGAYLALTNIDDVHASAGKTTANGAGFSVEAAVSSCLGEAVEYSSWVFRETDRDRLLREAELAGMQRINAAAVLGFSAAQLAGRERLNRAWDGWDRIPPLEELDRPRFWNRVSSFDGMRTAACPSFLCHGRFGDVVHGDPTLNVDSNGCAAGATPDMATVKAMLELVERDATGIWWDRGCVRPRLDVAFADENLRAALVRHREETGRYIWFLDISTFRAAAVVAAVSSEASGAGMALGFGAGFDWPGAMRSAFLELVQSEIAIEASMVRSERKDRQCLPEDRRTARWRRFANLSNLRFASGSEPQAARATDGDMSAQRLLDEIEQVHGKEIWFADLTCPQFGTPVVKAVCEGLAHYKLRRGSSRYADMPRRHGWNTTRSGIGRSEPRRLLI